MCILKLWSDQSSVSHDFSSSCVAVSLAWFHSILLLRATSGTTCLATFYLPEEICYHTCFVFVQINTHIYNIVFWVFMRGDIDCCCVVLGFTRLPTRSMDQTGMVEGPTVMYWELVRVRCFFAARSPRPQLFTVPQLQRQLIVSHGRARRRRGWGKTLAAPLNHPPWPRKYIQGPKRRGPFS